MHRTSLLTLLLGCGPHIAEHPTKISRSITLLDQGGEPRTRLHYVLVYGAPEWLEMRVKLRTTNAYSGAAAPAAHQVTEFPTVLISGRIEASEGNAPNESLLRFELGEISILDDIAIAPSIRESFAQRLTTLNGMTGSWHMTSDGSISNINLQSQADSSSNFDMNTSLRESWIIFPDTEIGIGAVWKVTSHQSFSGVVWNTTAQYRLKALSADSATVDVDVAMLAEPTSLSVEPNASTKLVSQRSYQHIEIIRPLQHLVPTSTSRSATDSEFELTKGRARLDLTVQMESNAVVRPVAKAK